MAPATVPAMDDLHPLVAEWPVGTATLAVTDATATLGATGDLDWVIRVASVSKILVGFAGLVALEEGAITLDEPAGPPGSTVRHLLAHASGLGFDEGRPLTPPGTKRIYSNAGIDRFADHLAASAGMPFVDYLTEAVMAPLGMTSTSLIGSPAHGVHSSTGDLLRFARELLAPTLVSAGTAATATTAHFPDLAGVVPGVRFFDPCPWGLTMEIRGGKQPHWTGTSNAPETFGHFGGSGTFLWVDPVVGVATVALTDRGFGPWALQVWPQASDRVLATYGR